MGLWLAQLFNAEELAKLEEKHLDILKSEIRKELATNPEIKAILERKLKPIYDRFKP